MNRNKLKTYAPQARRDFIQAVTDRAAHYGLSAKKIEPMTEQGNVAIIGGRPFPKTVGEKRKKLEARIKNLGFDQTMEAMAYTWFNRLVAIRFMELHGYLEHGYRVLSHPDGRSQPEILEHAQHVDLPGLDKQKVVALKLEGTKEEELYRLLLVGQCNALHKALPFLFESIDDETELLLPDHLLHSDSLIRNLVNEIPEEDWQEVEIIGWLYQFYISEKKDEVIGKVVKSEDIPAATQLFTPNWIVKYLVQNSLGRQWVATYPNSPLKGQMEYYIEPAEQTPEVQAKLAEITPTNLNPEELTLIDPACGSAHILTEAYDLLQRIYQERGYRAKDIPRLILEKNLFGLEIDDRAAQLAAFALMMKARADDRSIFERGVQPHVLSIQESKGLDAREITEALNQPILKEEQPPSGELFEEITDARSPLFSKKAMGAKGTVSQADVANLISLFEHGKTFGSLIQVPEPLSERLPTIAERVEAVIAHGGMFEKSAARMIRPLVEQAELLARTYDAVVANPPYMGIKGMNPLIKAYAQDAYEDAKSQLFSMFLHRGMLLARSQSGWTSMVTLDNWLTAAAYSTFRESHLKTQTIHCLLHMPYEGRGKTTMGIAFGTTATSFRNVRCVGYKSHFCCARHSEIDDDGRPNTFPPANDRLGVRCLDGVLGITDAPVLYWASEQVMDLFAKCRSVGQSVTTREGLATAGNERFLRMWYEVPFGHIAFNCSTNAEASASHKRWFPYQKGGDYRKWAGNNLYVVDWEKDGEQVRANIDPETGRVRSHNYNGEFAFRPGITWSGLSSSKLSVRGVPVGFMFDAKGPMGFANRPGGDLLAMAVLNSAVGFHLMKMLAPTLDFKLGHVMSVPCELHDGAESNVCSNAAKCSELSTKDWDSAETSWNFRTLAAIAGKADRISEGVESWHSQLSEMRDEMSRLEQENNRIILGAYGLEGELSSVVSEDDITLATCHTEGDVQAIVSYSVGCMMGRYSLDEPGLIYAHSGNQGFDPSKYHKFPADEDGIIPFTEFNWFSDDAASRFEKFIATAWPAETLEENLKFVAESLGSKRGETPRDTIRRYLANEFYKHHLSKAMYKNRPIYWLFSSGKQRGFQALVYLHRYNEGTLARMRTEYVTKLPGKMTARINHLSDEIAVATSSQRRKQLEAEKATITKQLAEVQAFDEQLRHFADQRIKLDLDDGVKVNYGKFGDLLAEVKAVCGKSGEEE